MPVETLAQGKRPFIDESLRASYLARSLPSVILLDVGAHQLPPIRGLDLALKKFDLAAQFLSDDPMLRRFQAAVPFRGPYTDAYSQVQSELVPDIMSYRIQVLNDLIRRSRNRDSHTALELATLAYVLPSTFIFDGLRVEYGNPRDNITDTIPSCINGLVGTVKEAALTYEADPNIEIIGFYPYRELSPSLTIRKMGQIVKGITVKVRDKEDEDRIKLVVDGVLADNHLEDILGLDWKLYMAIGILRYAQSQGIQRVIVNAENSSSHESTYAFRHFIATELLGLQEDQDFTTNIDPKTRNHVFKLRALHIGKDIDGFPYTHHLEKDPMPKDLVDMLAASDMYKGESYLETWYAWLTHVDNRADEWNSELHSRFPYAKDRYPAMKPAWNLGRGHMVGMEVDVATALSKLYQQF